MEQLLELLKTNARLSVAELAATLGVSEDEVKREIERLESTGVVRGYTAVIDEERLGATDVSAYIELKITPQPDRGFDELARAIAAFDEVQSVTLMSGGFDLGLTVTGSGLKEIANFVAQRLATLDGVVSTATHFVLKRYKEKGILIDDEPDDERGVYL